MCLSGSRENIDFWIFVDLFPGSCCRSFFLIKRCRKSASEIQWLDLIIASDMFTHHMVNVEGVGYFVCRFFLMAAEWHGMEHGTIAQLRVSGVEKKLWTSTSQRQGHAQVVGWTVQMGVSNMFSTQKPLERMNVWSMNLIWPVLCDSRPYLGGGLNTYDVFFLKYRDDWFVGNVSQDVQRKTILHPGYNPIVHSIIYCLLVDFVFLVLFEKLKDSSDLKLNSVILCQLWKSNMWFVDVQGYFSTHSYILCPHIWQIHRCTK